MTDHSKHAPPCTDDEMRDLVNLIAKRHGCSCEHAVIIHRCDECGAVDWVETNHAERCKIILLKHAWCN